jgi:hypothetical protein
LSILSKLRLQKRRGLPAQPLPFALEQGLLGANARLLRNSKKLKKKHVARQL